MCENLRSNFAFKYRNYVLFNIYLPGFKFLDREIILPKKKLSNNEDP